MPGLVKIGQTTKHPNKRASELSTTGVPSHFVVVGYWKIPKNKIRASERDVHRQLSKYRHKSNREFFKLPPKKAKQLISDILNQQEATARTEKEEKERDLRTEKLWKECDKITQRVGNIGEKFCELFIEKELQEKIETYLENTLPSRDVVEKKEGAIKSKMTNIRWKFEGVKNNDLVSWVRYDERHLIKNNTTKHPFYYWISLSNGELHFLSDGVNPDRQKRIRQITENSKLPKSLEEFIEWAEIKKAKSLYQKWNTLKEKEKSLMDEIYALRK